MLGVTDQADLELTSGDVRKSDGASETLVLLGIVVLETNLEFNGLSELSLLLILEDCLESLSDLGVCNVLAHSFSSLGVTLKNIFNTNNLSWISYIPIRNHQSSFI